MFDEINVPWDGWKIVKLIGKGSYGTVYEIERAIGSYVEKSAMKVISIPTNRQIIEDAYIDGYNEESITKMFSEDLDVIVDEYRIMEALSGNTNIVAVKDFAVIKHNDEIGWDVFIRMELLTPLSKLLKTRHLNMSEVYKLGMDICQALVLCEEKGLVHRDVKPENIFVTENGTFKLGDFGIARTLDHTTQATRAGTERYMAPEVIKREPYGKDVDLYSLGLVLYWLLNNRRMPFLDPNKVPVGDEPNVAQSRRLSGEALPRPVNGIEELQNIVLKACEYDREKRYSFAKEMLQDLTHVSESMKTAPVIQPEPTVAPAIETDSDQQIPVGEETQTDSWEEARTVGKDFLDDSKESEYDEAEERTLTPEWEEEKKSKEQKKNKEYNNQKYEKKDENKTHHTTEIDNSSSKNEPVPFPETINNTTKPKRFPPLLMFLIGGLIVLGVVVFAAINSYSNNLSSSSSYSLSKSSTTIGEKTFETVTFGGIEWIVLAEEGNNTLLLTKDILEYKRYHEEHESVTWETCTLRSYLNGEWYNNTFSDDEKDMILTTNVVNSDNSRYGTSGGIDTEDKVFLLSIDEVEEYFSSDVERIAKYNGEADFWWLRSPGDDGISAAIVINDGYVSNNGRNVGNSNFGIRPAIWVNLES